MSRSSFPFVSFLMRSKIWDFKMSVWDNCCPLPFISSNNLFKSVSSGISVLTRITFVIRNDAKSTKYSLRLSSSQKDSIFPMASIIFFTSDTCLVSQSSYFDFFMRLIRNFVICGLIVNWIRNSSSFPQKYFISSQTFGSIEETTIHISHNVVNLCWPSMRSSFLPFE